MLHEEWNDLFEIEDVTGESDSASGSLDLSGPETLSGMRKAADEALAACINACGRVDLPWMSAASGLSAAELTEALAGAVFQDPETYDMLLDEEEGWMLRVLYLSGNICQKLKTARRLNEKYSGRFDANVRALEAVLPERVDYEEIGIGLGSPWVPAAYYADFAKDILDLYRRPKILFSAHLHQWKVQSPMSARYNVHNNYTYGTVRMSALHILEHTLNARTVKIYDTVPDSSRSTGSARILNKDATLAVREKQETLQTAFREWVARDPKRVRCLEQIYYDNYACCVSGHFSGDFLTLPDLNPAVGLYPHQRDAVARIVLERDVLLNHSVGSGKTYAIIAGLHERSRMGLSDKNLAVVPNNVLEAFETAHELLYPQDRILVVHPEDFRPAGRGAVLERIRDEEFTAVYMAYSSFELIPMSRHYRLAKQEELVRRLRAQAAGSDESWERKRLERMASREGEKLVKMRAELPPDRMPAFDDLGITTLAVDEVHNFKNISLKTRAEGIVGMHAAGSKKCNVLYEKVQLVREQGGGIVFSTGTPLTNSLSDLFVLQSFLQPEQLDLLRIGRFDEWINNFAVRQSGFEVDVDGQNFRIMTRFSRFHNLPELTGLFANVCDFYDGADSGIGLPACDGYIDVVVQKSKEQAAYIGDLAVRTERIRQRQVGSTEDNLLKVTHDGRAAALDIRLTEPDKQPDPAGTKAGACADRVYALWKEHPGTAQLVFCDLGTPKKGFHVYGELKRQLTERGIPEAEIAFVHDAPTDAKRRRLFEAVNSAQVRVLIGSTPLLGTGVNVQRHLIAVHHLDVPWRPADMVQREGRMIRQGNENPQVYRYRYITAGTFDAYSWQILENKERFIGQFMSSRIADRDARDISDTVLTYAEIKALSVGDPLLKTRIETANQLERVKIRSRQRAQEMRRMEVILQEAPGRIDAIKKRMHRMEADLAYFGIMRESIGREERLAFGERLLAALRGNARQDTECYPGWSLHGFEIVLPAGMDPDRPYVLLERPGGISWHVSMRDAKTAGCVQRIEHVLAHIGDRIEESADEIDCIRTQVKQAKADLEKGNSYEAKAAALQSVLLDIDAELERRAAEDAA